MSSNGWTLGKLGDICEFKNGKKRPLTIGDYPIYGGNGILSYTNEYNAQNSIAIGRVGAYCGSVYLERSKFWISDNAILAKNNKKSDISFLYYLLSILQLNKRHIGTSQPLLTQEILNSIITCYPELNEQKAIAATLSCLDNMIELNNRTNQVLEEMAQAIFKRWFVDFEFPNEDGEPYKSSGGKMVDSELGEIPKGWDIGNLLDIADYLNGLAMQNFRPKENDKTYPVLKIKELRQGTTDSNSELCSVNINQNYIVDDGDLIFSWSGSLIVDFWCGGRCGLNQHLFKVTSNKFDKWYYYYWTNFHLQKFIGIAKDKATTMGHIKREDLKNSKVLIMDNITYQRLNSISNPIFETIIANRIENRKLATIRDTLLPKLMSGEIRVPVEEVV